MFFFQFFDFVSILNPYKRVQVSKFVQVEMTGRLNENSEPAKKATRGRPKYDPLPKSLLHKAAEVAANRNGARPPAMRQPTLRPSTINVDVVDTRKQPTSVPVRKAAKTSCQEAKKDKKSIVTNQRRNFKVTETVPENGPASHVEIISFRKITNASEIEDLLTTGPSDSDEKIKAMADFMADMKATFGLANEDDDFEFRPALVTSTPAKSSSKADAVTNNSDGNPVSKKKLTPDARQKGKKAKVDWSKVPVKDLSLYATDSEEETDTPAKPIVPSKAVVTPVKGRTYFDLTNYTENSINLRKWAA